ncbi:hypothetical protein [Natronoarchaeum rubrum]|uniref:hypothetical protein n=1 Tax=Natronoarchaeum rubrum TaxID=755311 RepID=UPI0021126A89|nr:hypothetical protein [Natronoarchaeum rubrum]
MVQDEVTWVLQTIKSNWPGSSFPSTLARINRDEPEILETDDRKRSLELEEWNAIGASLADRQSSPIGTEYDKRVETTISCRLEGLHADEWGQVDSAAEFEQLVRYVQHALDIERSYPTVNDVDSDDIGSVAYHTLVVENETDLSDDNKDYFRRDWDVRLIGYASLP